MNLRQNTCQKKSCSAFLFEIWTEKVVNKLFQQPLKLVLRILLPVSGPWGHW